MSKLNIDQKTIKDLLSDKKADFLIPDYQRPYAWTEDECSKLWEDIFSFAFPEDDKDKFDTNDEFFLGPIVTFKNENSKHEIIDGQQRLTTIMLLLRAFYSKFEYMKDKESVSTRQVIAKCIWKTNEFEEPDTNKLKIDSEVASDEDKEEFLNILKTGEAKKDGKSKYTKAFLFCKRKIDELVNQYPTYVAFLATRILNNVILLPIEAESQDTALRIFSTLNDRGLPLSDADIFKSKFYKYYSEREEKDLFIERWKVLEENCNDIFNPSHGTPMDELFARYMYFERAKQGNRKNTTEALRDFYEKNDYSLLKKDSTLSNLESLAYFWKTIDHQDEFSDDVLKRLFVLNYAPNGMWTYLVSVYFLEYRDNANKLDEKDFLNFLNRIIAFIWAYAIEHPGVNALRTPIYPEMINIVNKVEVKFEKHKFNSESLISQLVNYKFTNGRPITKSMLAWWVFTNKDQELLELDTKYEIEHIFAKKRTESEKCSNIEALGNKALLEKNINIRASDYRFSDKKKYYQGYKTNKGQNKQGTRDHELVELSNNKNDFTDKDIQDRTKVIIEKFINFLDEENLLE